MTSRDRAMSRNHRPVPASLIVALMALFVAGIAGAALAQVWTNLRAIEYGYELSRQSSEHHKLLQKNRRLRIELAVLKNPTRVSRLVGGKTLGLRPPEPEQIRRLKPLPRDRRPHPNPR